MKYTSVFLDLDNTLLDFNKAEAVAVKRALRDFSLPFDAEAIKTYSAINRDYWERFERGEIPKSDIFEGRFITFTKHYSVTADTAAISKKYCEYLSESYYTVDGTFEVLKYLKNKNYKLYATTNGFSFTQHRRIKESGLLPYFDAVFVSEDINHQKPEKEYFDCVIDKIPEKDRKKMLIIGDSQSSDILGGINSCIDTCWYNPKILAPKYPSKYEIHTLEEIKNIL